MEYFEVNGGNALRGEVSVVGAKNSILPLLAASLLAKGQTIFNNCPELTDVGLAYRIMTTLGADVELRGTTIVIDNPERLGCDIPQQLMEGMRSSFMFLGSLLALNRQATLYLPGGCRLGSRPVDIHIEALEKMGAQFSYNGNQISCHVPKGLRGADISLRFPSVGATENVIMAAVTARGRTAIYNAAQEPEISDLIAYLNACGAKIAQNGNVVVINGVAQLRGCSHTVIPDRILAATLIACCAVAKGDITLRNVQYEHIERIVEVFGKTGLAFVRGEGSLRVVAPARLDPIKRVVCSPYPGFPTDAGPLLAAVLSFATGKSEIFDTVFENRFGCAEQMAKLGAKMSVSGRMLYITGSARHCGGEVQATDLRGGAALACMALGSAETTTIHSVEHIDRGYAGLEHVLARLGAGVRRKCIGHPEDLKQGA